jgi:hypothetical protein
MTMTAADLARMRAAAARWDVDHRNQPEHCTTCGVELSAVEQYAGDTGCRQHRFAYTREEN